MSRQQESMFNERKLKPIYDCLDNGYFKKASQEIDKLLKKTKDWQYLKVLKALTFIRMNRQKDGSDILKEIFLEMPSDESTLQTMTICYRELQQNDKITNIYENAIKKDPSNEKLFTHLFMAYVRIQDYKKQQLTALNLYKAHPKNPYYFWSVMSIYMQAITAKDENIATKITLPLAEKMCEKFYKDNKFEADQELELYLMILERQQKYSEMIKLIDAPAGKYKMNDTLGFVTLRKVQLLKKESRYQEAFEGLMELVRANYDQYDYYIELYELALLIDAKSDDEGTFEYTKQLLNLLDEMCNPRAVPNSSAEVTSNETFRGKCRGPLMSKIIITHRIQLSAKQGQNQFDRLLKNIAYLESDELVSDLIYEFFERFASKYACVSDIIYLLNTIELSREQIQKLLLKIQMSLLSMGQEECLNDIYRSLCYHYLVYYIDDLSVKMEDQGSNLNVLYQLHKKTSELAKTVKPQSEAADKKVTGSNSGSFQPFDPVIYLMANKILAGINIYQTNANKFDLITLLESALANNLYDFYSKLLLIRLYNSLGAAAASHALYETLDIKLIQNDTLGHFFLTSFLTSGLYSLAQQFLNSSWKFYTFNFKEASDFIISFYKNGSFSKVEEINAFNDKLHNSLQYHLTFIEKLFLTLIIDCKNHLTFTNLASDYSIHFAKGNFDVDWNKVCDNRDLRLLKNNHYQLHKHIVNTLAERTCSEEILWLKFRFTLLQAVIIACTLSENLFEPEKNSVDNGEVKKTETASERFSLDSLIALLQQLDALSSETKSAVKEEPPKYCLEGPAPSRLISYFKNKQFQLVSTLMNYLLGVFKYCSRSECDNSLLALDLSAVFVEFSEQIETAQNNLSLDNIRQTLEDATNWAEAFSICISLLDVASNLIQKFIKSIKAKKKKKSSEGAQFKDWEQVISPINERFSQFRLTLDESLKKLLTFSEKSQDNLTVLISSFEVDFVSKLEDFSTMENNIKTKLNSSYKKSFTELTTLLQSKQKYLSSLIFTN